MMHVASWNRRKYIIELDVTYKNVLLEDELKCLFGTWTQNNKTNYFSRWTQLIYIYIYKLSYIYTFRLTGSHRQAAYESKEIQNFTAATDSQVWGLNLVTFIHDINYTKYKKVLRNYNNKIFIYNIHVKLVVWGL